LLDAAASALFVLALAHMRIAEASSVTLTVPLMLTAASVVLYGEIVGWRRWTAVGPGFLGVLLVVRPTPAEFNAWALVALASAMASTTRDLVTRRIGTIVPTITISFGASWVVALSGVLLMPGEAWRLPNPREFGWLVLSAVF